MSHLVEWLAAFEEMRRTNRANLNGYISRLSREMEVVTQAGEQGQDVAARDPAAAMPFLSRLCHKIRLIRWAWIQRRVLTKRIAVTGRQTTGVLALTTTRMPIADSASPRARFKELSRPLPSESQSDLLWDAIDSCRSLLVCEPLTASSLWQVREACWEEDVFIVDNVFCAVMLASTPLQTLIDLWRHRRSWWGLVFPMKGVSTGRRIATIVLGIAFTRLLDLAAPTRAFLLTGNSFATEVLRVSLIHSDRCRVIYEVLHGVPTVELEQYLARLFRRAPGEGKHRFIATLPNLPLFGVYAESACAEPEIAVNPLLNRYLFTRIRHGSALLEWFHSEYFRLFAGSATRPLIVTMPGANSHDRQYVESDSFAIERALLRHAQAILQQLGRPFALCYTPHPIPSWSSFERQPIFRDIGVILYPDTTFTWLVADLCIALHSSALFEAAFAGLKVFTPMRDSDSMYPPDLLNRLGHPVRGEGTLAALGRFLRANSDLADDEPRARIRRRAQRLWSLEENMRKQFDTARAL